MFFSHMFGARIELLMAMAIVSTASVTILPAAGPAHAAEGCATYVDHPLNTDGDGYMSVTANLKVPPYQSCYNIASAPAEIVVRYHGFLMNAYGNVWVRFRVYATFAEGLMCAGRPA